MVILLENISKKIVVYICFNFIFKVILEFGLCLLFEWVGVVISKKLISMIILVCVYLNILELKCILIYLLKVV